MKAVRGLKKPILLALVIVFLLCPNTVTWAVSESDTSKIDPDAFVYILNMGISGSTFQYRGLRNGFAVGDGRYILTAAHCVADFENTNEVLRQPLVISPYYGDIFEATIVAVDDVNDIAILKPTWDTHPALELETSEEWKKCETLIVMGYPPPESSRGGNGSTSRQILSEEVSLRYTSGKNAREVVVGPCRYPGVGWSGSPFINPKTGKVVGIFCRGDTYLSKKYIFFKKKEHLYSGPGVDSIRQFFADNDLPCETSQQPIPNLDRQHQFEQILSTLNNMKLSSSPQTQSRFKKLCSDLPDSYLLHIIAGWVFDPPENESYFQKAVKIAPNDTLVHAAYGYNLLASEKYNQAAKQFQLAADLDPNHLFASHWQLTLLVKTDPNSAVIRGQELTKQWPENADFYFEYSKALRAKNKRKEELPVIQKAIELCGEGEVPFQYWRYLAASLKANKQYEASERAYKKLLKTHECDHCWWAYTLLLLDMGPDKIKQAKKARDKTMTFIHDPNQASEKQRIYEASIEKMLSDPNTVEIKP